MKLSRRLMEVAERVPPGRVVVDVGADHGRLVVHLVGSGRARRGVAVELRPQPAAVARRAVAEAGLEGQVEVRLGDGLAPLEPGEVEVVCVAGMGGATIAGILERGRDRLEAGVERLVLQPNGGDLILRRRLLELGWRLVDEVALEERGRYYAILVAEPGDAEAPYRGGERELLLRVGPLLVKAPNDAMRRRWREERAHLGRVVAGLSRHPSAENEAKLEVVRREVEVVEAILERLGPLGDTGRGDERG